MSMKKLKLILLFTKKQNKLVFMNSLIQHFTMRWQVLGMYVLCINYEYFAVLQPEEGQMEWGVFVPTNVCLTLHVIVNMYYCVV